MGDNPHSGDNPRVLGDEITVFNDSQIAADSNGNRPVNQSVGLSLSTGDGTASWVSDEHPIPGEEAGVFDYAAGTTPTTVGVSSTARIKRISALASESGPVTITIGTGDPITIPAGESFDERIPGKAVGTFVVIAGSVVSYYVSWVD